MQIHESDEHREKTDSSIDKSFEPDSNVTVERDLQPRKQPLQIFPTEQGMQMDESDEHLENAHPSIRDSLEPHSNVTLVNFSHF
jgi:hypothetical protein